jgi:hypothetical protein
MVIVDLAEQLGQVGAAGHGHRLVEFLLLAAGNHDACGVC